ncbi:MAG: DUF4389 domain-containing protein [Gammaproteobacteria bacterium]|nr:DUF4389 domain-containing protein [Gammaproteobacteria bacterium]
MSEEKSLKEKVAMSDKWIRLVYMVLFVVVAWVLKFVVWIIAGVQFIYGLLTGKPLKNLIGFGESLSKYIYQIMMFLMYATEEKPFPFAAWPESGPCCKEKTAKKS